MNDAYNAVKAPLLATLSDALGVSPNDVESVIKQLMQAAEAGDLTDSEIEYLDGLVDDLERLKSIDSPWTFGMRYMGHKFVSLDPRCPACDNYVPHRTLIKCPTCGGFGPWIITERMLPSSHAHAVSMDKVRSIFNNSLLLSDTARADGMFTAIPRGGAKSTWLCEITALWTMLTGRARCVLVLSNTGDQAVARAMEIKADFEGNTKIISDFGVQEATKHSGRTWTNDEFIIANGARLVAKATGGAMRGVKNNEYRPDLVIADDVDDDKFLTTDEQADKLHEWWDRVVLPACAPNSITMFHGTVIGDAGLLWQGLTGHRGATAAKMVVPAVRDTPGCSVCGLPSQSVGPMHCDVCGKTTTAVAPSSFWGARFTIEALEVIKRRVGYWAFQSEYLQKAHNSEQSWWSKEWIDRSLRPNMSAPRSARRMIPWEIISGTISNEEMMRVAGKVHVSLTNKGPHDPGPFQVIVQAYDPAWSRERSSDKMKNAYMACVTAGLTWDDKIAFWGMDRRMSMVPKEYRAWMYDKWTGDVLSDSPAELVVGQTGMIIERNAAGTLFQSDIEDHWPSIPVIDHQTGSNKHSLEHGIPGLAGLWQADRALILGDKETDDGVSALCSELTMSGRGPKKDLLMATWIAWLHIVRWQARRDSLRYAELVRRAASKP